jgi:hypothetical protein
MLSLEKYRGSASRHTCPACGRAKRFTRYIDTDTGRYLADHVGRCDRESSCGYHVKPKDYFAENQHSRTYNVWTPQNLRKPKIRPFLETGISIQGSMRENGSQTHYTQRIAAQKPDFIDKKYLIESLTAYDRNAFVQFLLSLFPFDAEAVWQAVSDYLIGTHKTGRTIFWQIDQDRNIRTGKAIDYDRETGKRNKQTNPFWLHPKEGFELQQCFFGEHLLTKYQSRPVAIVEAEKSAVIASLCDSVFPDLVWLACGGKSNLNAYKLERLGRDRKIILYPDADGFEKWQAIASDASKRGLTVKVSNLIERQATDAERARGSDLADYLIREQRKRNDPARREAFRDLIEETLAIMMFDGGLSEDQAESEIISSGFFAKAINEVA